MPAAATRPGPPWGTAGPWSEDQYGQAPAQRWERPSWQRGRPAGGRRQHWTLGGRRRSHRAAAAVCRLEEPARQQAVGAQGDSGQRPRQQWRASRGRRPAAWGSGGRRRGAAGPSPYAREKWPCRRGPTPAAPRANPAAPRRGLWAIKKKNGGKFPTHAKKAAAAAAAEGKPAKFYPAEDAAKPLARNVVRCALRCAVGRDRERVGERSAAGPGVATSQRRERVLSAKEWCLHGAVERVCAQPGWAVGQLRGGGAGRGRASRLPGSWHAARGVAVLRLRPKPPRSTHAAGSGQRVGQSAGAELRRGAGGRTHMAAALAPGRCASSAARGTPRASAGQRSTQADHSGGGPAR